MHHASLFTANKVSESEPRYIHKSMLFSFMRISVIIIHQDTYFSGGDAAYNVGISHLYFFLITV
jgi:hypothetical protein